MPCSSFALGVISPGCPPLIWSAAGLTVSRRLSLALLVRLSSKTLCSRLGCDWTPYVGLGKLGSRASKTPHWKVWNRQFGTLLSSLVRVPPSSWFCRWTKLLVRLFLGCCRLELNLARSVCQFLQATHSLLCHSHIPSAWVPQIPLQSLWCEIRVRDPTNSGPTSWASFSHWRNRKLG